MSRDDPNFSVHGQVKITMLGYIRECIKLFEEIAPKERGSKSSAAPKDVFVVNVKVEKLRSLQEATILPSCDKDTLCCEASQARYRCRNVLSHNESE